MNDSCMITAETVKNSIERRNREIHKGDCGRVLLVAGSEGMMGAAILSLRGALRSGAGLVQLSVPKPLFPIAQVAVPEATCRTRSFTKEDLDCFDAVAVGPGFRTNSESVETLESILELYDGPLVLDADALNIVAEPKYGFFGKLKGRARRGEPGGETIITPHLGEARRLLAGSGIGEDAIDLRGEREVAALELAGATGATVVLKGAGTIVATQGKKTYTNTTGNPGMATGGAGDVLTGIIAGLWGQKQPHGKLSAEEAAVCGVFLHGLAGDLAAERLGEYGLVAGDIAAELPFAIRQVLEG